DLHVIAVMHRGVDDGEIGAVVVGVDGTYDDVAVSGHTAQPHAGQGGQGQEGCVEVSDVFREAAAEGTAEQVTQVRWITVGHGHGFGHHRVRAGPLHIDHEVPQFVLVARVVHHVFIERVVANHRQPRVGAEQVHR